MVFLMVIVMACLRDQHCGVPLGSTDDEELGLDEVIIPGSAAGEVLVYTLGFDDGTELSLSNGSFDGSNYGKPVGILLGDSLG